MALLAGTTLVWRGTVFDRAWALNPRAYATLSPLGKLIGIPFLLLAAALLIAGVGWFRRRLWGWALAVGIIATQVAGSLVNAIMGESLRGGVGLILAGALLYFLLRRQVRAVFTRAAF